MIPGWWQFLLLALAAYRVWRLLAEDEILDGPRARLLGAAGWRPDHGDPPAGFRYGLSGFITCPWCLGFWITVAAWAAWRLAPGLTVEAAVPFALSATVGIVAGRAQ